MSNTNQPQPLQPRGCLSYATGTCFFPRATAIALVLLVGSQTLAMAMTYYVAPYGDDQNPGTQAAPFQTVPHGLARADAGDTVFIESGTYDLAGFATTFDYALTLTGEDKGSTILTNGGTLTFSKSLTVENVTFRNWRSTVLKPSVPEGGLLDGVVIQNCIFENLASAINTGKDPRGVITNVKIANCEFRNMEGNGVAAISIAYGVISNVQVTNNSFRNLKSTTKGCSAVVVGSNATRATTKDILISENEMDAICGPTVVVDGAGPEVHGILAYGTNVRILKNIVRNLNTGTDHEAIYMKASHSVIGDNVVENCGSGGGGADITSKGGEASEGNVISGNRITGAQPGRGMLINGGTIVKGNHIKKPNGLNGIDVYAYGKPVTITNNYVETKLGSAIRLEDGRDAIISDNVAISYEGTPIKVRDSVGTTIQANQERQVP